MRSSTGGKTEQNKKGINGFNELNPAESCAAAVQRHADVRRTGAFKMLFQMLGGRWAERDETTSALPMGGDDRNATGEQSCSY